MMYFHKMLRYAIIDGIPLPFKIYCRAHVRICRMAKVKLASRVVIGNSWDQPVVSRQPVNLYFGKSAQVEIGSSVSIGPGVNIIVKDMAKLSVGSNTYFTSDMHIEVVRGLSIGCNCAISWGVTIIDDNHHELIPSLGKEQIGEGLMIGDHVWIGCNVTILKDTRIGNNCVIAAGSVVKGVFPDNSLIGGNPARVIKSNIDWR